MEGLLIPVSTAYKSSTSPDGDALIKISKPVQKSRIINQLDHVSTTQDALENLRSEPSFETLALTLKYLVQYDALGSALMVRQPSPISSQIVNALVTSIIPNYWPVLQEKVAPSSKKFDHDLERTMLLTCLRSATGLNAILMRLRALIQQDVEGGKANSGPGSSKNIMKEYLGVLEALLHGDDLAKTLWTDQNSLQSTFQRPLWKDIVSLVAAGKILNTAAEAWRQLNHTSSNLADAPWIADGMEYSHWLGRNIRQWAKDGKGVPKQAHQSMADLTSKALKLGFSDTIFQELLALVSGSDQDRANFAVLLDALSIHDQISCIDAAIRFLSKRFKAATEPSYSPTWIAEEADLVSGAAAYLSTIINNRTRRSLHLVSWLTSSSGAGLGESVAIRRVVLAVLAEFKSEMELAFEKSLQQFGDQLYIKHVPILQQEVHTQVLLISAGYIYRSSKMKLTMAMRTGPYLSSISNHLSASSPRSKFLGMVVGEALSNLVDKEGKQVNFKIDEMKSAEALWYKSFTSVDDKVGSLDSLQTKNIIRPRTKSVTAVKKATLTSQSKRGQSKILSIEELDDDYVEDDLVAYEKPDSDAEDSDEDPTLITRNKPTAPVYIRDLITYLRDMESYDKQRLGLTTAPSLIRRKTDFGTEVTAHVEELATILVGLQDKYDIPNFQDLRLQAMIAVTLALPKTIAPWFSKTFFDGDYSLSQRASILTVLSVSARELGGFGEQDKSLTTVAQPSSSFPSKQLPAKMHAIYGSSRKQQQQQQLQPTTIDALTASLSQAMIQPLAATAADNFTGPNILKVRTFSSRLAVQAKRKAPTTNALAPLVANAYFFPLTARFSAHLRAYGANNVVFSSYLLSAFVKTLSLILHAAGPHVNQLPEMTSEYWELLFGVRTQAREDKAVGEAVCVGFLTILEVYGESAAGMRGLVERHGRELMETQRWTDAYFGSLSSGSEEDNKVRSLAAAVLVRIGEVVEKYRGLVVGEMGGL